MALGIGKYAGLPILGYILYEFYGMYEYCAAPISDKFNAVKPDMDQETKMKFEVFLKQGKGEKIPMTSFIARNSWDAEVIETTNYIDEKFQLPPENRNKTVTIELVATDLETGEVIETTSQKLSRYMIDPEEAAETRNLWEDPDGSKKKAYLEKNGPPKPRASIPPIVEVGFVCEERSLDPMALSKRGFQNFFKNRDEAITFELVLFVNTLVVPRDMYVPAADEMQFEVRFHRIGFAYWNAQRMMKQSFKEAEEMYGMNEYDIDSFQQLISGPSPWKLIIVYSIAILHFIFEYMVIASDIDFWKSKTSFEGLSHHSIGLGIVMKLISLAYIIEDGKTKLVMYFLLARMSLDIWKFVKMMKVQSKKWEGDLEELRGMSNQEIRLMKITFILLMPLVIAFAAFRLYTKKFKTWYSFFILTLMATSQLFGFVVMMPQVFLNYRLKSVEHLPWKAMIYQAMNTFVDDLFTIFIRMPEVQKYSVFRDDIVFFICIYQRYIYSGRRGEDTIPDSTKDNALGDKKKNDDADQTEKKNGTDKNAETCSKEDAKDVDGAVRRKNPVKKDDN